MTLNKVPQNALFRVKDDHDEPEFTSRLKKVDFEGNEIEGDIHYVDIEVYIFSLPEEERNRIE